MESKVLENHERYLERKALYLKFGFDVDKERKCILDNAKPIFGNILEVGTGKGHFALVLAKEGYKFTSVDISIEEQEIAKLNLRYFEFEESVNFKIENAEHLSFEENSFDIIFSVNTLHHFKTPFKVMDEFSRVLTSRGKIILSDFNERGFKIIDKVHAEHGGIHEKGGFGLCDIETYLKEKGLKIDKYEGKFQEIITVHKPTA